MLSYHMCAVGTTLLNPVQNPESLKVWRNLNKGGKTPISFALLVTVFFCFFQVKALSNEWAKRAAIPSHVVQMLNNFPTTLHPMSQFSAAIVALNSESKFAEAYSKGVHKSKYWEVRYSLTIAAYFALHVLADNCGAGKRKCFHLLLKNQANRNHQ